MLPFDTSVEGEYADGYIHSETNLDDTSPYVEFKNVFDDILHKRPEAEHGRLVRFSMFYKDHRHDVAWVDLPENARPIRAKNISGDLLENGEIGNKRINFIVFGYQYTDENGKNQKEVIEL